MKSVNCELFDPICCEASKNLIFNHNFIFPNLSGDFPVAWQKCRGRKTADFSWEQDDKNNYYIKIKNGVSNKLASICQQRSYCVAVSEKQVWELGAVFKVNREASATIKVHFINRFSRVLYTSLDFFLEPGSDYYYGLVTVPADVDYAYIELGTEEAETLWMEDVVFKRVFPIEKYDTDAQGRWNINTVEAVKKIIDPVNVKGIVELKRECRDFVEDFIASETVQSSSMQDILSLSAYSFIALNQDYEGVDIQIQCSPDGIHWCEKCPPKRLSSGEVTSLCSMCFVKYVRVSFITAGPISSKIRIFFQGQG